MSQNKRGKILRVIVCGGRNFQDREFCFEKLDEIIGQLDNVEIVSGHAKGADAFGEEYALKNSLKVSVFKHDWKKYGLLHLKRMILNSIGIMSHMKMN